MKKKWSDFRIVNSQAGMTLLEIMIVLAILGGLITILAGQVTKQLDKARIKETKIQMAEIGKALDMFYTDCGFYPEGGLEDLLTAPSNCSNWGPDPYLKNLPKDPWGREYIYEFENGNYVLISYGGDRKPGGQGVAADITSEELQ